MDGTMAEAVSPQRGSFLISCDKMSLHPSVIEAHLRDDAACGVLIASRALASFVQSRATVEEVHL